MLEVHGRADDVILTAGATVAAADVEAELAAVRDGSGRPVASGVLVVGVPDRRLGERVCAVVEPARGQDPEAALQGRLAIPEGRKRLQLLWLTLRGTW